MPTTTVKPGNVDAGDADDAEAGRCGQARDGREELDVKPGDADAKRTTSMRKPGDADKPVIATVEMIRTYYLCPKISDVGSFKFLCI
jgi:hypothetical protein